MVKLSNKSSVSSNIQKIVLLDIDYTLFDTDSFKQSNLRKHKLFDEVEKALKELSKIAKLGIFSEGNTLLQTSKLNKTGIMGYLTRDYIHVVERKEDHLGEIFTKYKKVKIFLVDDKLSVLCEASKVYSPLFTIWLKRGKYAFSQTPIENFVPNAIIKSLDEVVPIVLKN